MTTILNNISELNQKRAGRGTAVTIGNFDGSHLGHQALFKAVVSEARARDLVPVVLTFDPHPAEALGFVTRMPRLQTLEDRIAAMNQAGIELVVVLKFDQELSGKTPEEFVDSVLIQGAGAKFIVVGEDFRFGQARKGDVKLLKHLGESSGFTVQVTAPVMDDGRAVSSTRIRNCVAEEADLEQAARLLGRPWCFRGRVIAGDKMGRKLGFPTANLDLADVLIPLHGVYAVWVDFQGVRYRGVMNIGVRPTLAGRDLRVEVHLLDGVSLNLYDHLLTVEPVAYLRSEKKFAGLEALQAQIAADCHEAITLLAKLET